MSYTKSDIQVYMTYDYDMFKTLLGNRDVRAEKAIIDSINAIGQIFDPILVNEKYEVVDGQNRLAALKTMKLPVYFTIQKGIGLDECRHMNIGRSNWSALDYIYSYAQSGNVNYQRLANLVRTYKKDFGLEGICAMAYPAKLGWSGRFNLNFFNDGSLVLSAKEYERANRRMITAKELGFVDICKEQKFTARSYYCALAYCFIHPEIKIKKLAEKMRLYVIDLPKCSKASEQLKYFSQVYNKGCHKSNKVYLDVDFEKGLYMGKEC